MNRLTLHSEFPRYLGKSSRLRFFKQAFDLKNSLTGAEQQGGLSMMNERIKLSLSRAKYIRSQPVRACIPKITLLLLLLTRGLVDHVVV